MLPKQQWHFIIWQKILGPTAIVTMQHCFTWSNPAGDRNGCGNGAPVGKWWSECQLGPSKEAQLWEGGCQANGVSKWRVPNYTTYM